MEGEHAAWMHNLTLMFMILFGLHWHPESKEEDKGQSCASTAHMCILSSLCILIFHSIYGKFIAEACICVCSHVCDGLGSWYLPGTHKVGDLLLLSLTLFLTSLPRSSSPIKHTLLTATATGEQMGLSEPEGTRGCCRFALVLISLSHPLQPLRGAKSYVCLLKKI